MGNLAFQDGKGLLLDPREDIHGETGVWIETGTVVMGIWSLGSEKPENLHPYAPETCSGEFPDNEGQGVGKRPGEAGIPQFRTSRSLPRSLP